jgi:hypothetical protein
MRDEAPVAGKGLTRGHRLVTHIRVWVRADKHALVTRPHIWPAKILQRAQPKGLAQLVDMTNRFVVATHESLATLKLNNRYVTKEMVSFEVNASMHDLQQE